MSVHRSGIIVTSHALNVRQVLAYNATSSIASQLLARNLSYSLILRRTAFLTRLCELQLSEDKIVYYFHLPKMFLLYPRYFSAFYQSYYCHQINFWCTWCYCEYYTNSLCIICGYAGFTRITNTQCDGFCEAILHKTHVHAGGTLSRVVFLLKSRSERGIRCLMEISRAEQQWTAVGD